MKNYLLFFIILNIIVISLSFNLRNSNTSENRIESNYNNNSYATEPKNELETEKTESEISSLKGIITSLV